VPVVRALWDRGVFDLFADSSASPGLNSVDLERIVDKTRANRGYLRVALRLLVSTGWLKWSFTESGAVSYALTPEGSIALRIAPELYREAISFIPMAIFLEDFLFGQAQGSFLPLLQVMVDKAIGGWAAGVPPEPLAAGVNEEIRLHLEGMLIGPVMVALSRHGILNQLEKGPADLKDLPGNQACLSSLFDLLAGRGWIARVQNSIALTDSGRYAARIAPAYGVTVSYLPMFSVISTLLFGNPRSSCW
jgi:hypothetical protein